MRELTPSQLFAAGLAAAALLVFPALAQDSTPRVSTDPEILSQDTDATLVIRGFFPSTDYAITSYTISPRFAVEPASARGANEFEYQVTLRYAYTGTGIPQLTPYEVQIPIGRYPRFARIKVAVSFAPDNNQAPSSWFSNSAHISYHYVRYPEPPNFTVEPAQIATNESFRATMRWYYTGYYAVRTTHEVIGTVIRIHQDVVYAGAGVGGDPISEAVVTHTIGSLPASDYTVEWRQSVSGAAEVFMGSSAVSVRFAGTCPGCEAGRLSLESTSLTFDAFALGGRFGPQTITLAPQASVLLDRIGTNNGDFMFSHDCPAPPATLDAGRSCTITVFYNGTLRGPNSGKLFVRYRDPAGTSRTTSARLSGRTLKSRGINFFPLPVTPDTAIEWYAPTLDHYFFTVDPTEQGLVDSGTAGDWRRTGVAFKLGGPTDVCRFYGDRSGPNSHFYTGNAAECAQLRSLDNATPLGRPAWRYEGIAFKAEMPQAGPPGGRPFCNDQNSRHPVYRLYNDGFDKGIDSNHRHVNTRDVMPSGKTAEDLVREMMDKGWLYEGNAFCN